MNDKKFQKWMRAIDDQLLEEAQRPVKKRKVFPKAAACALAACLCLVFLLWFQLGRAKTTPESAVLAETPAPESAAMAANPVQEVTEAELAQLGYTMPLPTDAENVQYSTVSTGEEEAPMAQITFLRSGQEYTYRASKSESAQDISGIYENWEQDLAWQADTLSMELRSSEDAACICWYSPDTKTQSCLSFDGGDALPLLQTAREIVETLGYDVDAAPDGAAEITYRAFAQNDLTVAETTFLLDGVRYAYHMASTRDVSDDFADISGDETAYEENLDGEVRWCPARLSFTKGGGGKIVWFDVVPGLLYSLTMDSGASEDALTELAVQIFQPAQEGTP